MLDIYISRSRAKLREFTTLLAFFFFITSLIVSSFSQRLMTQMVIQRQKSKKQLVLFAGRTSADPVNIRHRAMVLVIVDGYDYRSSSQIFVVTAAAAQYSLSE